jgi:hypothetical protein
MLDDSIDILNQDVIPCNYHFLLLLLGWLLFGCLSFSIGLTRLITLFLGLLLRLFLIRLRLFESHHRVLICFIQRILNGRGLGSLYLNLIVHRVFGHRYVVDFVLLILHLWNAVADWFLFFLLDGCQSDAFILQALEFICFYISCLLFGFNRSFLLGWLRYVAKGLLFFRRNLFGISSGHYFRHAMLI